MNNYLSVIAIYRFICGGLILVINWQLANSRTVLSLAIATILSFLPAIFCPVLIHLFFSNKTGSQITRVTIVCISLVSLIMALFYSNITVLVVLNFLLWIFFFIIETSSEMWFSELIHSKDEEYVNKFSAITMTTNQVALMIGPILIAYLRYIVSLKILFILFSAMYILMAAIITTNRIKVHSQEDNSKTKTKDTKVNIKVYMTSMLIWPILGTINFMLPTYTTYQHGAIHEVAFLDSALGIGMAVIGLILSKALSYRWIPLYIVATFISIGIWFYFSEYLLVKLALMLVMGLCFGGARVIFRKVTVNLYSPAVIKKIYAYGNALGLPVLSLCILVSITNLNLVWLPSFCLLLVLLIIFQLFIRKDVQR